MWNFVGRQNDIQGTTPGDLLKGNWESGIGFIDKARLGDQSIGPDYIVNSRAFPPTTKSVRSAGSV